jgi:hypothetical protein
MSLKYIGVCDVTSYVTPTMSSLSSLESSHKKPAKTKAEKLMQELPH